MEHDINGDHPERAAGSASLADPALPDPPSAGYGALGADAGPLGPVLTLAGLALAYAAGVSPAGVIGEVLARIAKRGDDHVWISLRGAAELTAEPCESPLLPGLISGGSSSGSAVAVAAGLVPFSIGTDTAGSGRSGSRSTCWWSRRCRRRSRSRRC